MKLRTKVSKVLSLMLVFSMVTSLLSGMGAATADAAEATAGAGTMALSIEGEAGTLSEVAGLEIAKNEACSNEYMVKGIVRNTTASVSFSVYATTSGERTLNIYHMAVTDDRALNVVVNNGAPQTVSCTGSKPVEGANGIAVVSTKVTLLGNSMNTVTISSNAELPGPNVDRIEIEQSEAEAVKTVDAMLAALPAKADVTDANKMVVTGVNKSYEPLKAKTGFTAANVTKLTDDLAKVAELNAKRQLVGAYLPIEAEMVCALGGSAIVPQKEEAASNGYYIAEIGGAADNKVTYSVHAKEAGKRLLKIYYATPEERNFNIVVNGKDKYESHCTVADWSKKATDEVVVDLQLGENTIVFGGTNGAAAPYLDKIEVELMAAERVSTINGLFDYVPDAANVTHENKMIVRAIYEAYRTVEGMPGIKEDGVNKLKAALNRIDILEGNLGLKYPVFPIEAEIATSKSEGTSHKYSATASNGWYAGNIGGDKKNSITFEVEAEEAAQRILSIYHIVDGERNLYVTVNNGTPQKFACKGDSWETPTTEPCQLTVTLQKGKNTITLGNTEGIVAPDVDSIKLELKATEAAKLVEKQIDALPAALSLNLGRDEKFVNATEASYNALKDVYTQATATELAVSNVKKLEEAVKTIGNMKFADEQPIELVIEGEVAAPASGAYIMSGEPEPITSNGHLMGGFISTPTTGTAYATINVEAELTTTRELKIYYATVDKRNLTVTVNDAAPVTIPCPGNNINNWLIPNEDPVTTQIDLHKGTNTIKFSVPTGESGPNIDKIVIKMTKTEAQATVNGLIKGIPEIISEDNKMVVEAINDAYISLPEKNAVTEYSKLVAALDKVANLEGKRTAEHPLLALEADLAACENGAVLEGISLASNGSHIRKLEGAATAAFHVNSAGAGKRVLKIYYAKKTNPDEVSKLNIAVNKAAPITMNLRGGSDYKSGDPRVVSVDLVAGANAIVFSGVNGYDAPHIDKIEIEMPPAEAAKEVVTMIEGLKDAAQLTIDDKGMVYAVEIAYNSLTDKAAVTNYAKLKAAVDRIKALEAESGLTDVERALKAAMAKFEELEETVAGLREKKSIYTTDSWQAVEDAFAAAQAEYNKAVNGDPYTPVNVDLFVELVDTLEEAVDALLTVDLKAVQDKFVALVSRMNGLKEDSYTAESWKAVADAYTPAKEEFDKGNKADYKTLDALCKTLEKALNNLKFKPVTVTFDSDGGTAIQPQTIDAGTKVIKPADPVKEEGKYSLMSWQLDGVNFDFETPVTRDITLKAKWILTVLKDLLDEFKGGLEGLPGTLNKDDYTDKSWQDFQNAYDNAKGEYDKAENADPDKLKGLMDALKDAIANLERKDALVTVTFDVVGGTPIAPSTVKVQKGSTVAKPQQETTKLQYVFMGWYDKDVAFDFATPITENKTLTAKWMLKSLKDALDQFDQLKDKLPNKNDYTEDSWKAVEDAYNDAKAEADKGADADPNKLRELLERLNAAIQGLVKKDGANGQAEVKAQSITIHGISKKIAAGKKVKLTADILPENATKKEVTWESSNTKYATVSATGVVKVKKAGKNKNVTITAKAADGSGVSQTYKIKIMPKAVKRVVLTAETETVKAGQKVKIESAVYPSLPKKQMNATLQWISSNTKYATVTKKGVVKTKKAGKNKTVKITAMATDGSGKKATVKIKLK